MASSYSIFHWIFTWFWIYSLKIYASQQWLVGFLFSFVFEPCQFQSRRRLSKVSFCLALWPSLVCAQACRDFLDLAESHSRRWQRVLQYEREQRTHLEETIEQLAKQHNSLERAWREAPTLATNTPDVSATEQGENTVPSVGQSRVTGN